MRAAGAVKDVFDRPGWRIGNRRSIAPLGHGLQIDPVAP
jgi:hypothetical protein